MKYRVTIPYPVFVTVKVEADSPEDAEELAYENGGLHSYVGNNGNDKLVGVFGSNVSVEPGDTPIEGGGFGIEVEEV